MDKFEKQFEDLDVQVETMEGSMQNSASLTTPQDQVESLMMEVADEHGWNPFDLNPPQKNKNANNNKKLRLKLKLGY